MNTLQLESGFSTFPAVYSQTSALLQCNSPEPEHIMTSKSPDLEELRLLFPVPPITLSVQVTPSTANEEGSGKKKKLSYKSIGSSDVLVIRK